ncbi:hypothetical protein DID88_008131 [Monilinia fructigena]|uniref:Uncharacterized protein n=1 Tax=Monilinia fructigena TaxID=38457 RepID=A0A395J528_9HELO|nr:hypothetical protein DID88_008131 [Monilinia fructigena]
MLALWQEAERRQTLSRHHREKGLLAFEKLDELYRRQEPIRHPHSKILGKTSHHRYSQMKRQREMDLLLKQVKELVAKERDPEFQAKQRQIRRLEEANQFIVDHDLRHFMDDKMKAEVSRQRAHIQAMEEQKAQWKADMECEIALADAREKKNIEITMSELVLGVFLLSKTYYLLPETTNTNKSSNMPFFGAFGQAFGSSTTLAAGNTASSHTNKSSNTISNQGFLVDITKDIELGNLLATSPSVVESARTKNPTLREKLHYTINYMNRTGFLEFMKTILLTMLLCLATVIPIDLLHILNDEVDWSFALSIQNIGVINGTVNYGNGTIAPLNNFNLDGSNLTISTCNYIAPSDLCTNNSHHLTSIRHYCKILFIFILTISIFFFVAVGNGVVKFRPGMFDRKDRSRYFQTKWPRERSGNQ